MYSPTCSWRAAHYVYGDSNCLQVTLCMMMWHCMTMWHYVWWCDTLYDDVTLCMTMWHYVWWCDTMYDDVTLCMVMWHYVWWCDTVYGDVTLCMVIALVCKSKSESTYGVSTQYVYMVYVRSMYIWCIYAHMVIALVCKCIHGIYTADILNILYTITLLALVGKWMPYTCMVFTADILNILYTIYKITLLAMVGNSLCIHLWDFKLYTHTHARAHTHTHTHAHIHIWCVYTWTR